MCPSIKNGSDPNSSNSLVVFGGRAHPELTSKVCNYLGREPDPVEVFKFRNDNTFVRILTNIRQKDVFIIQPTVAPINDHIMEMLIMIDACVRASAGRITAVMPYYSYARTDKKDQPRVPITARLVADLIKTAGANRALLMDLHAGQVQGFFSFPVDELSAHPIQTEYLQKKQTGDMVVVAPDTGISKRARDLAAALDVPLAIVEKRRSTGGDSIKMFNVIGSVDGKDAILIDDEIATGGTMIAACKVMEEHGARSVSVVASHGVLIGDCLEQLAGQDIVSEIVVTDTLPYPSNASESAKAKLKILSVAPLLGEAIIRINEGRSVGALFSKEGK